MSQHMLFRHEDMQIIDVQLPQQNWRVDTLGSVADVCQRVDGR